ncbi:MAG: hypothetical protein RLP44_30010 [Aggregatilineales bacterium]
MKQLFICLCAFFCLLMTASAQDNTYQNEHFSVQLPFGWTNNSTEMLAHANDAQTGTQFYALIALSIDDAINTIGIVAETPMETITIQLPTGEWIQNTYITDDTVTIVWSKQVDVNTHVMIASAPLSVAEAVAPTIQATIATYQIAGHEPQVPLREPIIYPQPSGDYSIGRLAYFWTDNTRAEIYTPNPDDMRELAITVWYPIDPVDDLPVGRWMSPELAAAYAQIQGVTVDEINAIQVNAFVQEPLAGNAERFPVLIMSHGDGLLPAFYTSYAENLASHGYVVFGVAHPYNATVTPYPDGRVATAIPEASAQPEQISPTDSPLDIAQAIDTQGRNVVAIHAADLRFVLDQMTQLNVDDPRFAGRLDLERIGVFGHSLGGATAIETLLQDSRVDSAANLDGTVFSDVSAGSTRPTMTIATGYVDATDVSDATLVEMGLSREVFTEIMAITNRARTLYLQSPQAFFVTIEGTQHNNFSDVGLLEPIFPTSNFALGEIEPRYALQIAGAYLVTFFDQTLRDEPFTMGELTGPYPESTLEMSLASDQ